jgi:propanediol dehydratase small subunit
MEVWADKGWAVTADGGLSAGSTDFELDVGQHDVLTGGTTTTTVGPTTLGVNAPNNDPYWAVVYVDSGGSLQTASGAEGPIEPGTSVDAVKISSPAPPALDGVGPVTVLGRALVTADGVANDRIDDRTFDAARTLADVTLSDGEIGTTDIATDAVTAAALDLPAVVVETPDRPPIAVLQDTESIELPIYVPDDATLEVYRWGAFDASDGSAPADLNVELLDGADTVQASANTANSEDTATPLASYQNSSGSVSIFKLRAKNDTGSPIDSPGVGAAFGYVVV